MISLKRWPIKALKALELPDSLKKVDKPPKCLYYRGELNENSFVNIAAIVGSRNMTRYGREAVRMIVPQLVRNGIKTISGFMYGVDTEVHKVTIEYGGITIAVLGTGLDCIYPAENESLYSNILENNGILISEYPDKMPGSKWSFPLRNRIVAGLADNSIIVIEAAINSGSLITAKIGNELGKTVFAVPGPINSLTSEGTNWLIKENRAKIYTGQSLIKEISNPRQETLFNNIVGNESIILKLLREGGMSADEIAVRTKKNIKEVNIILTKLALVNIIEEEGNKFYLTYSL